MKIHRVSLPLTRPLKTGRSTIEDRDVAIIEFVHEGHTGWGEAASLESWGTESLDEAIAALEAGESAGPASEFALDCARYDAMARAAGMPLWKLLALEFDQSISTPEVVLNATVGSGSIDETLDAVRVAVDAGFTTIKFKVGVRSWNLDVDRIAAVRERHPDLRIRLDANQAWALNEARHALSAFENFEIEYVEEPAAGGYDAFRQLAPRVDIPLAADETVRNIDQARRLIEESLVEVIVLKSMTLGAMKKTVEIVEFAREKGVDAVLTSSIDSAVGRTATAHLAAALGIKRACGLATGTWFARDVGPIVEGAVWYLAESPGLGFTPDAARFARGHG